MQVQPPPGLGMHCLYPAGLPALAAAIARVLGLVCSSCTDATSEPLPTIPRVQTRCLRRGCLGRTRTPCRRPATCIPAIWWLTSPTCGLSTGWRRAWQSAAAAPPAARRPAASTAAAGPTPSGRAGEARGSSIACASLTCCCRFHRLQAAQNGFLAGVGCNGSALTAHLRPRPN